MSNQALKLKQVIHSCTRSAEILAVTSGKGGVGKTNIATNLAVCLAASGKKVLLFDADFSLANVELLLNINSKYNLSHVLKGLKSIEEIIEYSIDGLEIISGVSGLEDMANLSQFHRQQLLNDLETLGASKDAIVIDTAAGLCKSVLGFCMYSDHSLVVTTPEPTAMADAYAMIKMLAKNNFQGRLSLIVNMAENKAEGKKTYQQIANVASRFLNTDVYDAGVLLKDAKLISAVKRRKPVVLAYPHAKISGSIAALAVKLSKKTPAQEYSEGFFRKVADWFY